MVIEARPSRRVTGSEAARIAKQMYGLDATATPLSGEYDDNFRLETASGARYVLKIMRPGCDRAFVDLQIEALHRLAELPVPRVVDSVKETGDGRLVWLLQWIPGRLLTEVRPLTNQVSASLGRLLGKIDHALEGWNRPDAHRELKWDLARAPWIRDYLRYLPRNRPLVERVLDRYEAEVAPVLGQLPQSVIHGDANDHNVVVNGNEIALIDFSDLHYTATVCELAIACAYAACGSGDPLGSVAQVAGGYRETHPLEDRELQALLPLILTRLAVSVTNSAYLKTTHPAEYTSDLYLSVHETPAWIALEKLAAVHPRLGRYALRGVPTTLPIPKDAAPLLENIDLRKEPYIVFDLSVGSLMLGADPRAMEMPALAETLAGKMREARVRVGIGRYNEARLLYSSPLFGTGHPTEERRTIHLGIDLFAQPGTPVCAPLDATVHAFRNNQRHLDYGPVVILRHETGGNTFFTLYGHLSLNSLEDLCIDQPIAKGQRIGWIGAPPENGGWIPHLHFQIILDLLDLDCDFPGVAFASQRELWLALSPDPSALAGIAATPQEPSKTETLASRRALLGRNLSVSYRDPLKIVRGWMQWLYDETGRAFLDLYNNVPLVGHSHPRVVEAVERQIALLNTNTRYLHDNVVQYAARLTALMPDPLRVCYFLNSASEANELALRLARAHVGREDVIVLEHAYHGHTNTLIDISPYKFDGPGGRGRKRWVRVAPLPDPLRRDDPSAGLEYARAAGSLIDGPITFIAESLPSVGGQVVFPPGYLAEIYAQVRASGGVSIADEVQVGFGRLGRWRWGFEMQGVVPDIVVLGKPMGNGFPLAGVVTTTEIAASFDNGMEFFSTYGGNPVACAAGLAVLDVLEQEGLQANARVVGDHLMSALRGIMMSALRATDPPSIVDVRGAGLFLGIELRDGDLASDAVHRLRHRGILAGTDGPRHNVIKIRPPLVVTREDADFFATTLTDVLATNGHE
ncbi:MAG TPA: aminotransferase class III-fold pyridoxal phosphate-dependent enzyme [Bryobacteraceae bacterium]|nr:aminotransferase class III-fold pyridoxal phosphate-dependent enzyme [Bryobacteraceae bacterium]